MHCTRLSHDFAATARAQYSCSWCIHTHAALRWDGMCCALRCDICIKWRKMMTEAVMLSATYCELMHINLYWSPIGSLSCELLHYTSSCQRSPSHPIPAQQTRLQFNKWTTNPQQVKPVEFEFDGTHAIQ